MSPGAMRCDGGRGLADERLPGLGTLLDAGAVEALLRPHLDPGTDIGSPCRARYLRWKPGTNALVAYSLGLRDAASGVESETWLYGKCFTDRNYPVAAHKLARRNWTPTPGLAPAVAAPEIGALFRVFPNDRALPGLRVLGRSKRIRRLLGAVLAEYPPEEWRLSDRRLRIEVVRYKPEKRAVVRLATRAVHRTEGTKRDVCVYLRTYGGGRGERALRTMRDLADRFHDRSGLRVPRPLAWVEERRLLFVEGLSGSPLAQVPNALAEDDVLARVAWDLWLLQCAGGDVPRRDIGMLLDDARTTARALVRLLPERQAQVRAVVSTLEALRPAEPASPRWVHGDFHPGQVLLGDGGLGLLDFDRAHRGDPVMDVGNFAAHLHALELERRLDDADQRADLFARVHAGATAEPPEPERLRFWTLHGLLRLAVRPFREVEPQWPAKSTALLDRCTELS